MRKRRTFPEVLPGRYTKELWKAVQSSDIEVSSSRFLDERADSWVKQQDVHECGRGACPMGS